MGLEWGRAGRAWAKACGVSYTHFILAAMIRNLLRIDARSTLLTSAKYNHVPPCQGFILEPYSIHDFVKEKKDNQVRKTKANHNYSPTLNSRIREYYTAMLILYVLLLLCNFFRLLVRARK